MDSGTGPKGGYLLGGDVGPMAAALRGSSIAVALGARTISGLTNQVEVPSETATGTSQWVAGHTAPTSDAEPTLGAVSLSPRVNVTRLNVSLQLLRSAAGSAYAPQIVLANAGEALDKAIISGAGGVEPVGILKSQGITTVSGTTISWATISGMRKTALDAGADEASLVWLAAPNVQNILAAREKAAGSGFIWANGAIDGIKAVATKRVPDNHLLLVPMNRVLIGGFGPGPTVETSASVGFNTASVGLRLVLTADVALLNPGAVVVSTTVS